MRDAARKPSYEPASTLLGGSHPRHSVMPPPVQSRQHAFHHDFSRIPVSTPGDVHEQEADRRSADAMRTPAVIPHVTSSGAMSGAPLPSPIRAYFEPRLDRSFDDVRIHTDARAATSARAMHAKAYTLGSDIVFGAGQFAPQHSEGRRLLAHELAHVMQPAAERRIFRWNDPQMSTPATTSDASADLESLLAQITRLTNHNRELRAQLDALPDDAADERKTLKESLDFERELLIDTLERRMSLLQTAIEERSSALEGSSMTSTPGNEANETLATELNRYKAELEEHGLQLQRLQRWQSRQRIATIDAQVAEIDAELAQLPPISDPNDPHGELLMVQREDLITEKKRLGKSLTSAAHEYEQFDKRWGNKQYGTTAECSKIKEGGCGPTTLAIVLNHLFAEDPEAIRPGTIEFITPDETAAFAEAKNARVCGDGTIGSVMVTQVETEWPGYRGKAIKLEQAASEIHSGNLVIFLCHNCTGQTRKGKTRTYGGHFMVLSGVDETGETFNVLDPGDTERADIETITKTHLAKTGVGYWIVEKK